MIQPHRLRERIDACDLSQSELARRIGISQASINKLAVGKSYDSKHLHRIARELRTTPEYLSGETDDPDENAPPPRPEPRVQYVTLPVALPSERALAQAFQGVLMASRKLDEAELARELAKRLPIVLRIAGDALPSADPDDDDDDPELAEAQANDHSAPRRAART